jgi:hypothetical protein
MTFDARLPKSLKRIGLNDANLAVGVRLWNRELYDWLGGNAAGQKPAACEPGTG